MAADMTLSPWNRLAKLAPPNTSNADLQDAANRYALTADLYAACADLWEELAMSVDTNPDCVTTPSELSERTIQSVSQDGVSITYADQGLIGNNMSSRIASQAQMLSKARYFRSKAKAKTVSMHDDDYNPWLNSGREDCDETVIVVDEV